LFMFHFCIQHFEDYKQSIPHLEYGLCLIQLSLVLNISTQTNMEYMYDYRVEHIFGFRGKLC
jgi:hypothetical protein